MLAPDLTEPAGCINFRAAPPDAVPGMSLDHFDDFPLLFGPSPVHPLERLTEHLCGAAIWVKRDDSVLGRAAETQDGPGRLLRR